MRRNVQEAIGQVRATIAAGKKYGQPCRPGMAWEVAETLADEVERFHKRLTEVELAAADAAIRAADGDPEAFGRRGSELVKHFVEKRRAIVFRRDAGNGSGTR